MSSFNEIYFRIIIKSLNKKLKLKDLLNLKTYTYKNSLN